MANMFNHLECPRCLAQWTRDEIEDQSCGACGWPEADSDNHEDHEPDLMGPSREESAERMHYYQHYLK